MYQHYKEYMKTIITALAFIPCMASAQVTQEQFNAIMGLPQPQQAPVYGLPVQPVLPVPEDKGPYGTGYSIVTTTRPTKNLWDRDVTGFETVQRIVPNDWNGRPQKQVDFINGWED